MDEAAQCSDGALSPYRKRGSERTRVDTSTERRRYTAPLLWLNLVCLDAPIVAVAWQQLFATTFAVPVRPANRAALFLTAWLIYLADRFGDSVSLPRNARRSRRQEFCARYHHLWIVAIGAIAAADLFVIGTRVELPAFLAGAAVGACAVGYLVVNQVWPRLWRSVPLKEVSVGFLFAAGTIVGLIPGLTIEAWPAWLLFASLCWLNCVSIAVWEKDLDVGAATHLHRDGVSGCRT